MVVEFQREYLLRLPLPLAQLYSRAHNAPAARARHDNAFYLFEAMVKLAACPFVAAYLKEGEQGGERVDALDRLLAQLALPSLGQWVAILRETAKHFGRRVDAASHPLGHVWKQLDDKRRDLPTVLALFRRIKNGPDGEAAGDQSCSLLQLFEALVLYRNGVFGHGAGRFESFFAQEMGPLLLPAANEVLAEGVLDLLGPRGSRLVHLSEIRVVDEKRVEISLTDLVGLQSERMAPQELPAADAVELAPNSVAILWPGRKQPLRIDPLLLFRGGELTEEVLFLNRDRNRQVEYLSYTTGRTERNKSMAAAMARLLSQITGRDVSEQELKQLEEQSIAETSSVETLFDSGPAVKRTAGDYEILAEIGRGGMGVVYLARQLSLGRLVALKMLPADIAGDEVALARFRREMRALARCEHPHIVKVLASGTFPDGQWFYTMEYVPGADLEMVWQELSGANRQGNASTVGSTTWGEAVLSASRKQRQHVERKASGVTTTADRSQSIDTQTDAPGHPSTTSEPPAAPPLQPLPLPPLPDLPDTRDDPGGYSRRVALMIRDTALAVQAVHEQNIVHRDIKPANLILTSDGSRVVLMDFGLAKGQSLSLTASRSGRFLGTLRYAAPEQLAAAKLKIGPSADVHALGVTMWELLTRRRIHEDAEDESQLTSWVLTRDLPLLRTIDPTLDRDLEAIVARATEREMERRIQSARELAAYLELYLDGKPLPIRLPGLAEVMCRWAKENVAVVCAATGALFAVLIVAVAAFVMITRSRDEALDARNQERVAKNSALELANVNRQLAQRAEAAKAGETAARKLAEEQRDRAERNAYVANMNLISLAAAQQNFTRARQLLTQQLPMPQRADIRGAEWYYFWSMCHREFAVVDPKFMTGRNVLDSFRITTGSGPTRIAILSGGKAIAIATRDRIDLCEIPSGRFLRTLPVAGVSGITALSSGSQLAAVAGSKLTLWDSASGNEIWSVDTSSTITALASSADGRRVATGGADGTIQLCDCTSKQILKELAGYERQIDYLAFSPSDELLASSDNPDLFSAASVKIWDVPSGQVHSQVDVGNASVNGLGFSHDGAVLGVALHSKLVIWNVSSGKIQQELKSQPHLRFAFSPSDPILATSDTAGGVTFWSRLYQVQESPAVVGPLVPVPPGFFQLDQHPSGNAEWTYRIAATLPARAADSLYFSDDGNLLFSTKTDVQVWSLEQLRPTILLQQRRLPAGAAEEFSLAALSGDGKVLAVAQGPRIVISDTAGNSTILEPDELQEVTSLAISPDGEMLAAATAFAGVLESDTENVAIRIWWLDRSFSGIAARLAATCNTAHSGRVTALEFSADGALLASGGSDATVRLWQVAANGLAELIQTIQTGGAVNDITFSPDGKRVACATSQMVNVWTIAGGADSLDRPGSTGSGPSTVVAFAPAGETLAVGKDSGNLINTRLFPEVGWWQSDGHNGAVTTIAFSADGRRLFTAGRDGAIKIWDAITGGEMATLRRFAEGEVLTMNRRAGDGAVTIVTRDGRVHTHHRASPRDVYLYYKGLHQRPIRDTQAPRLLVRSTLPYARQLIETGHKTEAARVVRDTLSEIGMTPTRPIDQADAEAWLDELETLTETWITDEKTFTREGPLEPKNTSNASPRLQ